MADECTTELILREPSIFSLFGGREAVVKRLTDKLKLGIYERSLNELSEIEMTVGLPVNSLYSFARSVHVDGNNYRPRYNEIRTLFGYFGLGDHSLFLLEPNFPDQSSREYWTKNLSSLMAQGPNGIPLEVATRLRAVTELILEDPVLG